MGELVNSPNQMVSKLEDSDSFKHVNEITDQTARYTQGLQVLRKSRTLL